MIDVITITITMIEFRAGEPHEGAVFIQIRQLWRQSVSTLAPNRARTGGEIDLNQIG